jgi:hypothetical protein
MIEGAQACRREQVHAGVPPLDAGCRLRARRLRARRLRDTLDERGEGRSRQAGDEGVFVGLLAVAARRADLAGWRYTAQSQAQITRIFLSVVHGTMSYRRRLKLRLPACAHARARVKALA